VVWLRRFEFFFLVAAPFFAALRLSVRFFAAAETAASGVAPKRRLNAASAFVAAAAASAAELRSNSASLVPLALSAIRRILEACPLKNWTRRKARSTDASCCFTLDFLVAMTFSTKAKLYFK
jgi:hypothetical protein